MILDSNARPMMPEMGPVSFTPPVEEPRDTEPTPVATAADAPPPADAPRDLTKVLKAMADFAKARASGRPIEDGVGLLHEALKEFALATTHPVALGVDYRVENSEGNLLVKDMTPAGEAFLADWSSMVAQLEAQSDKQKIQRLEMTVAYLANGMETLQRQVDNLAIDVRNLQKKVRG